MVKKRERKHDKIEAFAAGADHPDQDLSVSAPRGKKKGGNNINLPLNAYEDNLVVRGAKADGGRSILGFVRLAAIERAKKLLNE
ncbi:MAG: hypothetical protein RPV21_01945 [Candidatus Sedimenticola sp. (ex Thyasira tokunagai)]